MNEFRCARAHATGNNKRKFMIAVLYGDISVEDVNEELKFYLETNTYLEYSEWVGSYLQYKLLNILCNILLVSKTNSNVNQRHIFLHKYMPAKSGF